MDSKPSVPPANWQPFLIGSSIRLRPLVETDLEALYQVASDPLIWEQHPERERFKRENFTRFFRSGMESNGALIAIDLKTGAAVGSSRFTAHNPESSQVEVGYTFLSRAYWGQGTNREMKSLMLHHAFQHVDTVHFYVGESNLRSQNAMLGIGAFEIERVSRSPLQGAAYRSVVYGMEKSDWVANPLSALPKIDQAALSTARLALEPISEGHAEELWELFKDPELHTFVPFEAISIERQRERCVRWSKRRSPSGDEIWLNWLAREKDDGRPVAHFQAGIKSDGVASIGYLVSRGLHEIGRAHV